MVEPFDMVRVLAPIERAPLASEREYEIVFDPERETPALLFMITPPVALNVTGNSFPVTCAADPLYCIVAFAP